jgi:hypothetical protein
VNKAIENSPWCTLYTVHRGKGRDVLDNKTEVWFYHIGSVVKRGGLNRMQVKFAAAAADAAAAAGDDTSYDGEDDGNCDVCSPHLRIIIKKLNLLSINHLSIPKPTLPPSHPSPLF